MNDMSLKLFHNSELLTILLFCLLATFVLLVIFHFIKETEVSTKRSYKSTLPFVKTSREKQPILKKEWFMILLVAFFYTIVSFHQLGSNVFPTTTWQPTSQQGQSVIFELPEETQFSKIVTIYGEGNNNALASGYQLGNDQMTFEGSNDLENWQVLGTIQDSSIFKYSSIEGSFNYRYVRMNSMSYFDTVSEIGIYDATSDCFLPIQVQEDAYRDSQYPAELLIDEQDKLVSTPTYYDEAYFDEIYHPRNAYEIANGLDMYATVHPLLGTNVMALSIKLFGNSPFAWRLPGAIFGILIVFMIYFLARLIFQNHKIALIAEILCAADFMHITTSRIATLEPISVFLILVMFYFMIRYYYTSFYDTSFKKTLLLLLASGISMGLAISAKWTACYSAIGLAILLFTNLGTRFYEYHKAKYCLNHYDEYTESQRQEALKIKDTLVHHFTITILWCFVFFIFIPIIIYVLVYLPDRVWKQDSWSISNVWKQCLYMYNYHTNLTATHPYQSNWYEWLVDARPIWYYFGINAQGNSQTIACFSNPLLTWTGLIAIIYCLVKTFYERSEDGWIILVGFITALGPWMLLVNRCVFSYHFYPTSMFVILAIAYLCKDLDKSKVGRIIIQIFLFLYIYLFLLFLPVTCGFPTTLSNIKSLEWFSGWYFG